MRAFPLKKQHELQIRERSSKRSVYRLLVVQEGSAYFISRDGLSVTCKAEFGALEPPSNITASAMRIALLAGL